MSSVCVNKESVGHDSLIVLMKPTCTLTVDEGVLDLLVDPKHIMLCSTYTGRECTSK